MSQPKSEIEDHYKTPDPWGYISNPEDIKRRLLITQITNCFGPFARVLDIGAGEGIMTLEYNGLDLFGYEISDFAASRFPKGVVRETSPNGAYDLITATGVMYSHYDWEKFLKIIDDHAAGLVMVSSIKSWEVPQVTSIGKVIFEAEFPYREYTQRMRIFDVRKPE